MVNIKKSMLSKIIVWLFTDKFPPITVCLHISTRNEFTNGFIFVLILFTLKRIMINIIFVRNIIFSINSKGKFIEVREILKQKVKIFEIKSDEPKKKELLTNFQLKYSKEIFEL